MANPATTMLLGGDLTVNRMGFGAMRVTGEGIWGPPRDKGEALAVLRTAVERGVNFIDTADSYGPGVSEALLAEALHPYPEDLVIATKGGLVRPGPESWERNGDPAHLRRACEESLKRLRRDRIDLYQLHAVDPRFPVEDSLGALVRLQAEGKIRHIGLSNVDVPTLERAQKVARVVSVQNRYSVADRGSEPVVQRCEREGLAFLPWYPLGSGRLPVTGALEDVARAHAATPMQIALAWLLQRSPVMVVIPGTSKRAHLEENLAASRLSLRPEEMARLGGG